MRTYRVDVADAGAVQRAADDVVRHWGGLDVWINDAMVSVFAPRLGDHRRRVPPGDGPRELNVGGPTWRARLGNALLPGLLDRFLARSGYDSQQTDTPIDPATWRDNLDRPGDDEQDRGAEGVFTDRARGHSAALWVSKHKPAVSAVAVGGLVLTATGLAHRLR